jgi:hypothetical protein
VQAAALPATKVRSPPPMIVVSRMIESLAIVAPRVGGLWFL